ncbi:unnamed protein product [Arabidopsis lyrata]|nr:unnamed protein product [Arabidopsis lyrata]
MSLLSFGAVTAFAFGLTNTRKALTTGPTCQNWLVVIKFGGNSRVVKMVASPLTRLADNTVHMEGDERLHPNHLSTTWVKSPSNPRRRRGSMVVKGDGNGIVWFVVGEKNLRSKLRVIVFWRRRVYWRNCVSHNQTDKKKMLPTRGTELALEIVFGDI